MSGQLLVPDAAVRYILFQRTGYLRFPVTLLYRYLFRFLPFPLPIYNLVVALESRLGVSRIKARYQEDMKNEYLSIKAFLPHNCSAVLDIGCGVAGIDVFIDRHYADQRPDFYLLDKSRVETSVYYMFNARGAFYNSFDVARELLIENGVAGESIHLLEANDDNEIMINGRADLVLSLLSWGFHYPVWVYRDRVYDVLGEDGVAILDVRKGTDGVDALKAKFRLVDVVMETEKSYRLAVRR